MISFLFAASYSFVIPPCFPVHSFGWDKEFTVDAWTVWQYGAAHL